MSMAPTAPSATASFLTPPHRSHSGHVDFSQHPDLDLSGDSQGQDDDNSTTDDVVHRTDPSQVPPAFDSDAYQALLLRVQTMARESSERWNITESRHLDYLTRFRTLDDTTLGNTTLLSSISEQVTDLRTSLGCTTFTAQEALELATSTRTTLRQYMTTQHIHPTETPPPANTASLDDAFDATEAALRNNLDGLATEVGDCLDRNIAARSSATSTPARHPRFTNVNEIYTGKYNTDSDRAYAAAHPSNDTTPGRVTHTSQVSSVDGVSPAAHDTLSYGNTPRSHLGSPTSPHPWDTLVRGLSTDILSWHAGVPTGGDAINGLDFMEVPDIEVLGVSGDVACFIVEYHYDIVQNWNNPRWVQRDQRDFSNSSYMPPSAAGPNTTDILKQLSVLDKLTDLTPTGWQTFYNKLRRQAIKWKIALVPFEAINLKYECQGHGLCVCGLGLIRWRKMGDALFVILENLLPSSNAIISTTLSSLGNGPSPANGYELLWILLKEFIPMFDCTRNVSLPSWPASDDIFEFGRLVLMYCDMARHRGPPFTEAMKSRMFLSNVQGRYRTLAHPYSALVGTYCPGRDGITRCPDPLPMHLTVLELARSFYDSIQAIPDYPDAPVQSVHTIRTPPLQEHPLPASSVTTSHTPQLTATSMPSGSTSAITSVSHPTRPTTIQGYLVNITRAPVRTRSQPNPSQRSTKPTTQRTRYEGTCDACGKYGHPAARCDMLAMALFLQRYSRDRTNAAILKEAEERWMQRNKPFLPRDDRTPRTILANYCAELNFQEDKVDGEMDWEFLHDPDFVEESDM